MVLWHLIANIGRVVTRHVGIRWEGGSSPPSQDRLKRVLTSTPSSTAQDLEAKSCSTYGWTCCIAEVYIYDIMLYKSIRLYACIQAIFDTFVETGKLYIDVCTMDQTCMLHEHIQTEDNCATFHLHVHANSTFIFSQIASSRCMSEEECTHVKNYSPFLGRDMLSRV